MINKYFCDMLTVSFGVVQQVQIKGKVKKIEQLKKPVPRSTHC